MNAGLPTRPADLPHTATLGELAAAYGQHAGRLVDAHHGIGQPLPADTLAGHALGALAAQHALAERALYSRWCNARDALVFGATLTEVAAAMGLDDDEVTLGLTRWADGQRREGLMTPAEHAEVLSLVGGAR